MGRISINVQKEFCAECALAVSRFIGRLDGVEGITTNIGSVIIDFDERTITSEGLLRIARESIEKLGYRTVD